MGHGWRRLEQKCMTPHVRRERLTTYQSPITVGPLWTGTRWARCDLVGCYWHIKTNFVVILMDLNCRLRPWGEADSLTLENGFPSLSS